MHSRHMHVDSIIFDRLLKDLVISGNNFKAIIP